jgi:hypothetical protein
MLEFAIDLNQIRRERLATRSPIGPKVNDQDFGAPFTEGNGRAV